MRCLADADEISSSRKFANLGRCTGVSFDAMGTRTLYITHSQRIHPKPLPHGPCQLIRPPILPSNHFIMLVNNHPSLVQC